MYRRMMRVQLAAALGLLSMAGSAEAQGVDPRCAKARDKLGCTCAVQNGGGIDEATGRWYSTRSRRAATNEAFIQCQLRAGRR